MTSVPQTEPHRGQIRVVFVTPASALGDSYAAPLPSCRTNNPLREYALRVALRVNQSSARRGTFGLAKYSSIGGSRRSGWMLSSRLQRWKFSLTLVWYHVAAVPNFILSTSHNLLNRLFRVIEGVKHRAQRARHALSSKHAALATRYLCCIRKVAIVGACGKSIIF